MKLATQLLAFLFSTSIPFCLGSIGRFDFYVFAMSYQPEFCFGHRSYKYEGCEHPRNEWRGDLTIHGLWPQYANGTWPASCSNEPLDIVTLYDLGVDRFERYWPNVKALWGEPGFSDFWSHEWMKHGTCSGLDQEAYFKTALEHVVLTPELVREKYGHQVTKNELTNAYSLFPNVIFVCEHGRYLSEVRVCLGKSSDGSVGNRMACPDAMLSEGNCEDVIFVSKFYSDHTVIDLEHTVNLLV